MRYIYLLLVLIVVIVTGCENEITNDIQVNSEVQLESDVQENDEIVKDEEAPKDSMGSNETTNESTNETSKDNTQENNPQVSELVHTFQGIWMNKDEPDIILELQDGVEIIGVQDGQVMSYSEYQVTEEDATEQSIIIHGFREDEFSEDEISKGEEYSSKLYLKNNGKELLYVNDYLNTKIESEWTK